MRTCGCSNRRCRAGEPRDSIRRPRAGDGEDGVRAADGGAVRAHLVRERALAVRRPECASVRSRRGVWGDVARGHRCAFVGSRRLGRDRRAPARDRPGAVRWCRDAGRGLGRVFVDRHRGCGAAWPHGARHRRAARGVSFRGQPAAGQVAGVGVDLRNGRLGGFRHSRDPRRRSFPQRLAPGGERFGGGSPRHPHLWPQRRTRQSRVHLRAAARGRHAARFGGVAVLRTTPADRDVGRPPLWAFSCSSQHW